MHVDEPCTTSFKCHVLDCTTTIYVYKRVICCASRCMCWDGNSSSWREWDKTGRRRRFGYFGGGELETTDLGSRMGVHSSGYTRFYGFQSLGVGVLLVLGGHELAHVRNRVGQPLHGTLRTHNLEKHGVRAELCSASAEPYLPAG
jgi:hypothetical protein